MTDIVDDILSQIQEVGDSLTPEKMLTIELSIRRTYGGTRPYIRQSCKSEQQKKADKITRDYIEGSVDQVTAKHGISRATLYRMIKR